MNEKSLDYWEKITLAKYYKAMSYAECYGMVPVNLKKIGDEFDKSELENKNKLLILLL